MTLQEQLKQSYLKAQERAESIRTQEEQETIVEILNIIKQQLDKYNSSNKKLIITLSDLKHVSKDICFCVSDLLSNMNIKNTFEYCNNEYSFNLVYFNIYL